MGAGATPGTSTNREAWRSELLRATRLLDSSFEDCFERLTRESAEASDKQVALVSLVDDHRQWFKSVHDPGKVLGGARETPREYAFCHHAIQQRHPFLIENAHDDPRFRDNPLVTDGTVGFYYGVPLEVHHQDKCVFASGQPRNMLLHAPACSWTHCASRTSNAGLACLGRVCIRRP
eukprot:Tamp_20006.p1 GENE.Tamp_20006~~Tamp_20006.p1  ORF type:complete len:185 (+),score=14.18 Tamp_20006:26-556(+)